MRRRTPRPTRTDTRFPYTTLFRSYTIWRKRRTPKNIVIGGAAGAFPPMIGWAAVTGGVDLHSLLLFALIFVWTPPHFWALALYSDGDYAKARVPMLPVVAGRPATRRQIMAYSLLLAPLGVMPAVLGTAGVVYEDRKEHTSELQSLMRN